jgi:hypothetical protein
MIGTAPPPKPADYETAAREVMAAVRAGKPIPNAVDPMVDSMFEMMAPEAVRAASGGDLAYAVRGPADSRGELPWIQSVEVRAPNEARETYSALNAQARPVPTRERLVFGYFTTLGEFDGSFRIDTDRVPEGPIRNTLEAPDTAGTARMWFSTQDNRGGVDVVARSVIFE